MTDEERKMALMFAQRLEANAAHAEALKFTVCNLSTLKNDEARALATILREAAEGWNFDMDAAPKDGTDLDLFDGIGVVHGAFAEPLSPDDWWGAVGEDDEAPDQDGYQEYLEGEIFGWVGCEPLSTDVLYLSPIAWRPRPKPPTLPIAAPPAEEGK